MKHEITPPSSFRSKTVSAYGYTAHSNNIQKVYTTDASELSVVVRDEVEILEKFLEKIHRQDNDAGMKSKQKRGVQVNIIHSEDYGERDAWEVDEEFPDWLSDDVSDVQSHRCHPFRNSFTRGEYAQESPGSILNAFTDRDEKIHQVAAKTPPRELLLSALREKCLYERIIKEDDT